MSNQLDQRQEERSAREQFYNSTPTSRERYAEATEYMPGGSTRGVLFFDPYPVYADHGDGSRITDVDGNEYVDFLNNYTSLIHGHAPEGPVNAAIEAIKNDSAPGMPTEAEIGWARHLVERVPALDHVRFTNSGTEATMNAIRCARAYTGNDLIAKCEGVYHGTHDEAQVSVHPPTHLAGPRDDPEAVPDSAGVSDSTLDDVLVIPFNDPEAAVEKLERHREELAGVLVAPLMGSAVVPATDSFIDALDEFTSNADVPLVFDEVISFRVEYGGAAADYGVEPDLITFGKIIGGGFPVGAFGGREELLAGYDPRGGSDIVHSGTFNANPVTATAGTAALEAYTREEVSRINGLCDSLVERSLEVADRHGYDIHITKRGSLFNIYLATVDINDYRDRERAHGELTKELYFELLTRGVRLAPKLMGCTSTAMDNEDVDRFVEAFDESLAAIRPIVERRAPDLLVD